MQAEVLETPRRHRLTVEDYQRMAEVGIVAPDARTELIDGEILDMALPQAPHVGTVLQLDHLIKRAVGEHALISVQSTVVLGRYSAPQPDLAVLQPRADFYKSGLARPGAIRLLIEVADSSLRHDRNVKAALYARHAIPEYWLVDVRGKHLARYRDPDPNGYARIDEPDLTMPVPIPGVDGAAVALAPLFDR